MIEVLFKTPLAPLFLSSLRLLIVIIVRGPFLLPHTGQFPMARNVVVVLEPASLVDQSVVGESQVVKVDLHVRVLALRIVLLESVVCRLDFFLVCLVCHTQCLYMVMRWSRVCLP